MSYSHYGEIGDVWKHLPLAAILSMESPTTYWESHAASGTYALTPTPEQEYGVLWFLDRSNRSAVLKRSSYRTVLDEYRDDDGTLRRYPGSPVIAMRVLSETGSDDSSFLFCDIEDEAIDSIRSQLRDLPVRESQVETVVGDGISALADALSETPSQRLASTFAHIDPYDPTSRGGNGRSSWELFRHLVENGVSSMLWYGYQTADEEAQKTEFFEREIDSLESAVDANDCWIGEIVVDTFRDSENDTTPPGVFGCGIVCGNLADETIETCRTLGEALETIYADAPLPDGNGGSISFNVVND